MATVETEVASEVKCILCGESKFSTHVPFLCFRCWKNGEAAKYIVFLQGRGTTKRALDGLTVCENCGGWLKGGECENCSSPLVARQ